MTDSPLFIFLNKYPIFPCTSFAINALAFLPSIFLLYMAQLAPLHANCRFILSVWATSYGALYTLNLFLVKLDFENATGYMPVSMVDPPFRYSIFQWHVVCTTFCSSLESALSIERMVAIINPRRYHFSAFAWKSLTTLTILLLINGYAIDSFVHSEYNFGRGCVLLFTIELSVLITGVIAARVCLLKYSKKDGKSSLSARYQVKEACEMSTAMIPAYIISFFLKISAIILLYVYFIFLQDYEYLLGYVQNSYALAYACNGGFSLTILLLKHPQLRKQMKRKFRSFLGMRPVEEIKRKTNEADTDIYFTMLSTAWK